MRVGDVVVFNRLGKKIYVSTITAHKWRILKFNRNKTEVIMVREEHYDYFYDIVKDVLTQKSLNGIYDMFWATVDYQKYPYCAIHINNLKLHRVESQNKDNTDKLKGVPAEFFKTPE